MSKHQEVLDLVSELGELRTSLRDRAWACRKLAGSYDHGYMPDAYRAISAKAQAYEHAAELLADVLKRTTERLK